MAYDKLINYILFIYLHIQKKKSNQITQLKQIPEAEITPMNMADIYHTH